MNGQNAVSFLVKGCYGEIPLVGYEKTNPIKANFLVLHRESIGLRKSQLDDTYAKSH
jgi:hypothetical protein